MLRTYCGGKIHGLRVTGKSLEYNGSASLPPSLMRAAGVDEFEAVYVVNKANGNRWQTYAIAGPEGEFTLNGAAARQGEVGDECLLWVLRAEESFTGANVLFLGPGNEVIRTTRYGPAAGPEEAGADESARAG